VHDALRTFTRHGPRALHMSVLEFERQDSL